MYKTSHGYIKKWYNNKYQYEHIIVAESLLGFSLPKGWIVHHKDLNRINNNVDNLIICNSVATHKLLHRLERCEKETGRRDLCWCSSCKSWLERIDMVGKRNVGHCKICHAKRNRESGRVRDYKREWEQTKKRQAVKEFCNVYKDYIENQ